MQTITKEYQVYKFDELKPEVQSKVIERLAQRELENDWWDYSGILDSMQEDLKEEYGITCFQIYFDLYRNYVALGQAYINDIRKFLIAAGAEKWMIAQGLDSSQDKGWDIGMVDIGITKPYREYFNKLEIESHGFYNADGEAEGDIEAETGISLNDFFRSILEKCLKQLKDEEEYISSEENIKDLIELNEYQFLENGEIF